MTARDLAKPDAVVWHDVECGSYAADLETWDRLAAERQGSILELGAGTGRVTLRLAGAGFEVTALDSDPRLLHALTERARDGGLGVETVTGDARTFDVGRRFDLIVAPMQFLQLFGREDQRAVMRSVAAHLEPNGAAAFALIDGVPEGALGEAAHGALAPLPDVRELDGWIYSSLPLGGRIDGEMIEVRRLRQRVDPTGELDESIHVERLRLIEIAGVEALAQESRLAPTDRLEIEGSDAFVGSTVLVVEASR